MQAIDVKQSTLGINNFSHDELLAIKTDCSHILRNIDLSNNQIKLRESVIEKIDCELAVKVLENEDGLIVGEVLTERFTHCPSPETKGCDKHKINDEEGRWVFCNTCKKEWSRN